MRISYTSAVDISLYRWFSLSPFSRKVMTYLLERLACADPAVHVFIVRESDLRSSKAQLEDSLNQCLLVLFELETGFLRFNLAHSFAASRDRPCLPYVEAKLAMAMRVE